MAFSPDGNYLVSVGVQEDRLLAIWDVNQHVVLHHAQLMGPTCNQVRVDPFTSSGNLLQFVTIGNSGSMTIWRCELDQSSAHVSEYKVVPDPCLVNVNFCALDFTHRLPAPANTYYILIGASDGTLVSYDP